MSIKSLIKNSLPESAHIYLDNYYSRLTSPLYYGNNVRCNICNGRFSEFAYEPKEQDHVRCPRCRSYSRHRLIWFYIKRETTILENNSRVLHMAPELLTMSLFKRSLSAENYVSADLFSPLAMVTTDITDMLFKDEYFDYIICSHVLEHIEDDHKAMKELYRVLKPGGEAILLVPMKDEDETYEDFSITDPKERETHFGQFDHVRWYGRDFKDRLENVGFEVTRLEYAGKLSPKIRKKYALKKTEPMYICKK